MFGHLKDLSFFLDLSLLPCRKSDADSETCVGITSEWQKLFSMPRYCRMSSQVQAEGLWLLR